MTVLYGCTDGNSIKERILCINNLRNVYDKIQLYVEKNGDLPRNSEGDFSLSPLNCNSKTSNYCLNNNEKTCNLENGDDSGFVVNPKLNLDHFLHPKPVLDNFSHYEEFYNETFILLCHDIDHLHSSDNENIMLLSNGSIGIISIESQDTKKFKTWIKKFKSGETNIITFKQLHKLLGKDMSRFQTSEDSPTSSK